MAGRDCDRMESAIWKDEDNIAAAHNWTRELSRNFSRGFGTIFSSQTDTVRKICFIVNASADAQRVNGRLE
jgi:hypothetical protein